MLLRQLPFQLFLTLVFSILAGSWLPQGVSCALFTLGMFFKDVLMAFIPFVVCGYLMSSIVSFDKKSLLLVLFVILLVTLASFCTALGFYGFTRAIFPFLNLSQASLDTACASSSTIEALWSVPVRSPFTPTYAIVTALLLGFVAIFGPVPALKKLAFQLRDHSTQILKKYFIPFLPLYVLAILLKIQDEGSLRLLFQGYGKIALTLYGTIFLIFLAILAFVARFSWVRIKQIVSSMLPALITGGTTMSGVAAMPFLVDGVTQRTKDERYAEFIVPLTTNIHTFGDGAVIIATALAILGMTHAPQPSFGIFLIFAFYYCLSRFFNACVPGGGILIAAPFVREYLGLDDTAIGLLTTLYVLQDPIITMLNTAANSLLALGAYPLFARYLPTTTDVPEAEGAPQTV